jgi:hypothetical protein
MRTGRFPLDAEPLGLPHKAKVSSLLQATGSPLSEYSFANLYLFRQRHDYHVIAGDAPAVLGRTYDGERHALPLGPLTQESAHAMLERADCLFPIDEAHAGAAEALGLASDWREADCDYVYDRADLGVLAGAKAKRAQARSFAAQCAPTPEPLTPSLEAEANEVLDGWMADTHRAPGETDDDACREAIGSLSALELSGLLVRTGDGRPVAFMISSTGAAGSEIVHFAKGRRAFDGVYPWMFARFAQLSAADELNFEQDLGHPGFAQSKKAFAPKLRRRKLRLRWKPR